MSFLKNFWKNDNGFISLLIIVVLIIMVEQLTVGIVWADLFLIRFGFFVVTIIAVAASTLSSTSKRVGYVVAVAVLLLAITLTMTQSAALILIYAIMLTSYTVIIIRLIVKQIFATGEMTFQKIGGGIAVYILLGHLWTSLYITIYFLEPEAFLVAGDQIVPGHVLGQLSYFSFVTLTTTGYGDITAVGATARTLVIFESLVGQLFPAIFIARLVGLQMGNTGK